MKARTESASVARLEPDPDEVRGTCPLCGAPVVTSIFYSGSHPSGMVWDGYGVAWECWRSQGKNPKCDYKCLR